MAVPKAAFAERVNSVVSRAQSDPAFNQRIQALAGRVRIAVENDELSGDAEAYNELVSMIAFDEDHLAQLTKDNLAASKKSTVTTTTTSTPVCTTTTTTTTTTNGTCD